MKQRRGAKKRVSSPAAPAAAAAVSGAQVSMADFIGALFQFTEREIYFSSLPNERDDPKQVGERRVLTREIAIAESFLARWDRPGRAVYFCVSTISGKRNKANAIEIAGLFTDSDFKSIAAGEAEIRKALEQLRCPPTMRVHSGNGFHSYWLFNEPLLLTPDNRDRVEAALRQLADLVAGDLAVCEVARLMRLPGSHNSKGGSWLEVTVERIDGPRYELDDLEEWLAESAPVLRRALVSHSSGAQAQSNAVPDNPFLAAARLLGFKPPIDVEARLEAMRYGGAGDSSIHSTQLSVSASLLNAGRDLEEVVGILMDATRAAAGELGTRWNWIREERALCRMCATWVAKHPPAPKQLPLERENAASLTADGGNINAGATSDGDAGERAPEPAAVIDLAGARAQRKAKPKKGDTPLHIVVGEATLAVLQGRGERVLFTEKGVYRYRDGLWCLETDPAVQSWLDSEIEACARALSIDSSSRLINEARKWIIRNPDLRREGVAWDAHGMVPTGSGLIEPRTGKLIAAAPEHYTTWRVPHAYDATAACPRWLQMLEDAFADRDEPTRAQHIQLLQELLGMGLIDRKPKPLSLALVVLGGSDTGKSGMLDVLGGLFGPDSITVGIDTLEGTHALMPFAKRRPWVLHEAFNQSKWHLSSTMKTLISGNPIQINLKGGALFSHRFTAPIFLGANSPPQFKEATHAIANRLAVVACRRKFDRNAPVGVEVEARAAGHAGAADLVLATELPGVLAWAVDGLRRALARGMFELPAESLEAGAEIIRDANIVAGFVEDATAFDRNSRLLVADCWAAFSMWWIRNKGDDRGVPSRISMGRALKALNEPRIATDDRQLRDNHARYYGGIKLNEEGVKLWRDALKSEAFELKGKLADATSADALPYDDIPGSWDGRAAILAMRKASDRWILASVTTPSSVTTDPSSVTDPSPDPSPTQPVERAKKPLF